VPDTALVNKDSDSTNKIKTIIRLELPACPNLDAKRKGIQRMPAKRELNLQESALKLGSALTARLKD
jgi:hypothetical protein